MKIHLPTSLVFTIPWVLTHRRFDHHDHTADYYGEDDDSDDCHFDSSPYNYKDKPHHLFSSSVSSYSSHFHLVCFRRYLVFHPIHPTCWPSNMYCIWFFVCWQAEKKSSKFCWWNYSQTRQIPPQRGRKHQKQPSRDIIFWYPKNPYEIPKIH